MKEKNYSLKQLYQFVTQYCKEANDEGFDRSVGDFVDWIASQDEKTENRYVDPILTEIATNPSDSFGAYSWSNRKMTEMLMRKSKQREEQEDKPVLPEKLKDLASGERASIQDLIDTREAVNDIIEYLSRKEQ